MMRSPEAAAYFALVAALFGGLVFGTASSRYQTKHRPNEMSYRWGYFAGWSILIFWGLIGVAAISWYRSGDVEPLALWISAFSAMLVLVGYGVLVKSRIAWVVFTVLTHNPLIWIVNGFYGSKRWHELRPGLKAWLGPISALPRSGRALR